MRPPLYQRQLRRDLDEWIDAGLVPVASREPILARVSASALGDIGLAGIFALLGAILLGVAAMSFIGANWQGMQKLPKLAVLFGSMWAAYALAFELNRRGRAFFAEAAITLGIGLYGVAIMLVSQTYHIAQDFPEAMLLWSAGALVTSALAGSRAALCVAVVLGGLWTIMVSGETYDALHWQYLILWAGGIIQAIRLAFRPAFQLSVAGLVLWLTLYASAAAWTIGVNYTELRSLLMLLALGAWLLAQAFEPERRIFARDVEWTALLIFVFMFSILHWQSQNEAASPVWLLAGPIAAGVCAVGAMALRVIRRISGLDVFAVFVAAASVGGYPYASHYYGSSLDIPNMALAGLLILWAIVHGVRTEDRFVANVGFIGFGCWVLYVYNVVFSTLLDQAAFFAGGGVLLIVAALILESVRRRVVTEESP